LGVFAREQVLFNNCIMSLYSISSPLFSTVIRYVPAGERFCTFSTVMLMKAIQLGVHQAIRKEIGAVVDETAEEAFADRILETEVFMSTKFWRRN
jgi:hypothetical protein